MGKKSDRNGELNYGVVADRKVGIMHVYRYGNMGADIVLIQLAGNHDISEIKDEVAEIQHLTSMDFELIAVKLMIGIRNCPHGRLLPYLEMKILETERYRHWKRFCYYVQIKVKRIILGDILFQGCFHYGLPVRQICSPELRQHRRLSGFRDL
mgnify:FL=1